MILLTILFTLMLVALVVASIFSLNKKIKSLESLYEQPHNRLSFEAGLNLTGMPVVSVFQGKKMMNLILDSGSTCNVINEPLLQQLDYTDTNETMQHIGIEGEAQKVKIVHIQFGYKNISFTEEFTVRDMTEALLHIKEVTGVTIHGVVGSNFFRQNQYILDFKTLEAYTK